MYICVEQKDKISPDSYEDDAGDNTHEEKDNAYHSKGDCNKITTIMTKNQKTGLTVTF